MTTVQDYLSYPGNTNINPYMLQYTSPSEDIYVSNKVSQDLINNYNKVMNEEKDYEALLPPLEALKQELNKPVSRSQKSTTSTPKATNEVIRPSKSTASTTTSTSMSGTPLSQKDTVLKMREFYKSKGLSDVAINGLIGVAMSESGLNYNIINQAEKDAGLSGYGKGLFQWSDSRKTNLQRKYGENPTLEQQLEFSWEEMQERPEFLRLLQSAKTIEEATDYVHRGYTNGSKSALVTPEQMQATYSKSWANLPNHRAYDYQTELNRRIQQAYNASTTI